MTSGDTTIYLEEFKTLSGLIAAIKAPVSDQEVLFAIV